MKPLGCLALLLIAAFVFFVVLACFFVVLAWYLAATA